MRLGCSSITTLIWATTSKLDKYFNNDEYPGLKQAFTPELLETNKINGHNYSIPFMTSYSDPFIINIRKDIREELGLPPVKTSSGLQKLFGKSPGEASGLRAGLPSADVDCIDLAYRRKKDNNDIRLARCRSRFVHRRNSISASCPVAGRARK